jgi:EAL domain-containing protein (putative c-di-GMP-specific phosphodiesterase class I)
VKIDRAFVAEAHDERGPGACVAASVARGHALGIRVFAEGVETEAQRAFLEGCGCDFLQGYLAGRPVDADTAAKDYV